MAARCRRRHAINPFVCIQIIESNLSYFSTSCPEGSIIQHWHCSELVARPVSPFANTTNDISVATHSSEYRELMETSLATRAPSTLINRNVHFTGPLVSSRAACFELNDFVFAWREREGERRKRKKFHLFLLNTRAIFFWERWWSLPLVEFGMSSSRMHACFCSVNTRCSGTRMMKRCSFSWFVYRE